MINIHTVRAKMRSRLVLLVLSVCMKVSVASSASCSGDQDCSASTDLHCYRGNCKTSDEIAKLAFDAGYLLLLVYENHGLLCPGKTCTEHSDCPEACQTRLSPAVCGPYLRSVREPGASHPDDCSSDQECDQEESCITTPRGTECLTWQQVMVEFFHIG